VIAQEVQEVMPTAVMRGDDGYLRVDYGKLNVKFETYAEWLVEGARVPTGESEASSERKASLNH
jgi:hypothetical protein